jgi:hypothetical protein
MKKNAIGILTGLVLLAALAIYIRSSKAPDPAVTGSDQPFNVESNAEKAEPCAEGLSGYSFLKKSKILNDAGIGFYVGEPDARGVIVHQTCSPLAGPFQGVSEQGLVVLKGDTASAHEKLNWGCGEQAMGALFSASGPTGLAPFLIAGKTDGVSIRWVKATPQKVKAACKAPGIPYGLNQQDAYAVEGISGQILIERFTRKDPSACLKDNSIVRVSRVSESGSCEEWVRSEFDCDAMPSDQNQAFTKVLGLIEIRKGETREEWMIFETPGYEGIGVSAFPWREDQKILPGESEFLVYSGC